MIRRNSVVSHENEEGFWIPFGRVVKIKDDQAFVIFCTRDSAWIPLDNLTEHDYKGTWRAKFIPEEVYVWDAMPTLRKLKQMASHYNPEIWNVK